MDNIIKKTTDINSGLNLEFVNSFDQLDKYADSWNLLALNAQRQHPVMSHAWITAYLKTMVKKNESWFCLFAFDNKELIGVFPLLYCEYSFLFNNYIILYTPDYPHTNWIDFLFNEKYGKRVMQLFAEYLNAIRPKVLRLKMSQIPYDSPAIEVLQRGIKGISFSCYQYQHVSIIPVNGSFIDYRRRLPKKMVSNLRRSENLLKKFGGYKVTIENGKDVMKNLESFATIEASGWKGHNQTSIKDKYWNFFSEFTINMSKKGWLKWYFLEVANKRIAAYMTIFFGRSAFILKTAYHEEYKSVSPGSVLTLKMIEHIFSSGNLDEINFFTDYDWLLRWNVERKPYYNLVISFNNPGSFFFTRLPIIVYSRSPFIRGLKSSIARLR